MAPPLTRIFSDLHFGDHASRLVRLAQLRPLLDGVDHLVLNGDSLDTRPGPRPAFTAQLRAEFHGFNAAHGIPTTVLTGNHDPDLSSVHALDLAAGRVFVTHGDVLFDTIVPWSLDAPVITGLLAADLARHPPAGADRLADRLARWRRVAALIPQRHQSEPHRVKYALRFAADTVWPPLRVWRILTAWQRAPALAAALLQRHRPAAGFILIGHTHRPGLWRTGPGVVVINTGSFCAPLGGLAVDLTAERLVIRRIVARAGAFHPGAALAEFSLAADPPSPKLPA